MEGEQILIVEDNEKNMKLVRDILRHRLPHDRGGHRRGWRRARARRSARPVLMDIQLPDIDGIDALEKLRAAPRSTRRR